MARHQALDAQRLYDARSSGYDNSWHPRFASHMVQLAKPQPGESVLDLACGTGLVTFPVAEAVGESGSVLGIDISSGMLAEARSKLEKQPRTNMTFCQHSITDLGSLQHLQRKEGTYDLIICASALVLLPEPTRAVMQWTAYLKPQGRLVVDTIHNQAQLPHIIFERVGQRLGIPIPYYRLNFTRLDDLRNVMENAGLRTVDIKAVSQLAIEGTEKLEDYLTSVENPRVDYIYDVDDGAALFGKFAGGQALEAFGRPEARQKAEALFKEEWIKLANREGKVIQVDCVFVAIGWKS